MSTIEASLCCALSGEDVADRADLANGLGTVCSGSSAHPAALTRAGPLCGILLNRSFRHELAKLHARKRRDAVHADEADEKASLEVALPTNAADVRDLSEFPIELARLKVAALSIPLCALCPQRSSLTQLRRVVLARLRLVDGVQGQLGARVGLPGPLDDALMVLTG